MKKHFQVTFDFSIDIDKQITCCDGGEMPCEYTERQNRLLQAILSDEQRLATFLRYQMVSVLQSFHYGDWHELFLDESLLTKPNSDVDLSKLLQSSIETLSLSDQAFFAEMKENDVFFENTEEIQACFSTDLEHIAVKEAQG